MPSIRVTQGMQYLQTLGNLQRNHARLFDDQDQLASGRRVRRPSDDPVAAARILEYARRADELGAHRRNGAAARDSIDTAAADLQSIADVFVQARERVVQGLSGTLDPQDRATIASELENLIAAMLGHANSRTGEQFTFAGSRGGTQPFEQLTGADGIERVRYLGDGFANLVAVGPGISQAGNVPGSRLVEVGPRGPTTFFGSTGARPGVGSDSGVGRARLTLTHAVTVFGPQPGTATHAASGLKLGASSAQNDTILGLSHVVDVTVDATGSGTVSLNGGAAVAFSPTDSDLAVAGPGGEIVHLDLSGVTPGFSGPVPLVSYGAASLDGGQTQVALDFTAAGQRLISPIDGSVTHLDATAITRTGTEDVTYGGTLDVFNALLAIRDLFRTDGEPAEIAAALDEARLRLDDLDRANEAIVRTLAATASDSERLSALDQRLADLEITVAARRSEIEDADLATLISALQENEAVYESSLLVAARLGRISLANFL